jgi:hypothetical protein
VRIRLSPISFYDEPNRDYVLTMHLLLAAIAGTAAIWYRHLGWWSAAIAVALALVLELALRSRYTAWLSMVVGSAFSAAVSAIGGAALAIALTNVRAIWWTAAALAGGIGALLAIGAYRSLRKAPMAGSAPRG